MKKIIIPIIVVLLLICSYFVYTIFIGREEIKNAVEKSENVSNDLFEKYYDEATKIIDDMTIEEKVGQLLMILYDGPVVDKYIKNYNVGNFLLFARDLKDHTQESMREEIDGHKAKSKYGLGIAVDEEGGFITRVSRFTDFRSSKFLSPKDYYEQGGYELLEEMENEKATLLKSLGININLAPVADISTNEDDFIYIRTFGRDANETSIYIKNMVSYAKNNKITSCLKHFPGYGNNEDTHTGSAIDNREYDNFVNNDYLPFKSGIEEGVPFILVSHNVINAVDSEYPASLSKKVITGELREKLNFSGIVITDDLDMDAIDSYREEGNAATLAINAGADMIITSYVKDAYNELIDAVNNGTISEERIDESVRRIIAWKIAYEII